MFLPTFRTWSGGLILFINKTLLTKNLNNFVFNGLFALIRIVAKIVNGNKSYDDYGHHNTYTDNHHNGHIYTDNHDNNALQWQKIQSKT